MHRLRLLLLACALLSFAIFSFAIWHSLVVDLPSLERLTENLTVPSTKILARDGRLLYQITDPAGVNHTAVPLEEIPLALRQATVATEDASFYTNPGVDLRGILRALWINVRGGRVLAGGSTITQQVARNVLLDPQERSEQTLTRKLRETLLAWRLSGAYSKDQILELYLSQTYYGHLSHGVEAAAQAYFGKGARELDLAESALLAGLPQAPGRYDPLIYPEAAQERQSIVLGLMEKSGYISQEQRKQAETEALRFASTAFPIEAPHFVFYVWSQLEARLPPEILYSGLTVTTTLDLDLTRAAEAIIRDQLAALACSGGGAALRECRPANATDGALVALDPRTGQVLAMVGSPDYFSPAISGSVNMALAPRQPGSALKPVIYAAAFDPDRCANATADHRQQTTDETAVSGPPSAVNGLSCPWTPATLIFDVRRSFLTREGLAYTPQNFDRRFHGPVLAREALASSLNVPAVITLAEVGLPEVIRLAGELGITTLADADRFGLALALGGGEVRMLDLATAYAAFANGGRRVQPASILQVTDPEGRVIESYQPRSGSQVLDPRIAYLITDILSDNRARALSFGENSVLQIGRPAGAKTGTTTNFRDNWTVGYTPSLVAAAWVGNADNSEMQSISGIDGAGPIWHDFMRQALKGKPEEPFNRPSGLEQAQVCALSGLLPTPYCPSTRQEWFISGTQPRQPDTLFQPFTLDGLTGQLAGPDTPPERQETRVFTVLPPEAQQWARETGIPSPPGMEALAGAGGPQLGAPIFILSPEPGTVFNLSEVTPAENQQVPLRVAASTRMDSVTYVLDGQPLATLSQPPFEFWWPLQAGTHRLLARGSGTNGEAHLSSEVWFTVLP